MTEGQPSEVASGVTATLSLIRLGGLMARHSGSPKIAIGLIDGPVATRHPDLVAERITPLQSSDPGCISGAACAHGTFVAGILLAQRGSGAPAICPHCSLLSRPIFSDFGAEPMAGPTADPGMLAAAVVECVDAGARIINVSAALSRRSPQAEGCLEAAFDHAMRHGALVVAAAGNQGDITSSAITRHPWVIPVAACDLPGRPMPFTNLGSSIGRNGLCAPGRIESLSLQGPLATMTGTSVAAPLVTGTIALIWTAFPRASAAAVKAAVVPPPGQRRRSLVPPLLDAERAYRNLTMTEGAAT